MKRNKVECDCWNLEIENKNFVGDALRLSAPEARTGMIPLPGVKFLV